MDIKRVAQLAKLELSQEQENELKKDLERIISFVKALEEIDTENVEPFFAFEKLENLREDTVERFELDRRFLKLSDGYFRVQRILEH
ncbi:MAG: Asp-tRNA(Asn)/Glu-tRNA(Gln) amidotransferase subunit GatC [Aquificaceae bacterium]